jgi:hypothetical protein
VAASGEGPNVPIAVDNDLDIIRRAPRTAITAINDKLDDHALQQELNWNLEKRRG